MNKEQHDRAVKVIAGMAMLCNGYLATDNLAEAGDLAFFRDNLEGNVKVAVPTTFNCAMGALAEDVESITPDHILREGSLAECYLGNTNPPQRDDFDSDDEYETAVDEYYDHENDVMLSSIVEEEFGLPDYVQERIMGINDASPTEVRKRNVIKALGIIYRAHDEGRDPDQELEDLERDIREDAA